MYENILRKSLILHLRWKGPGEQEPGRIGGGKGTGGGRREGGKRDSQRGGNWKKRRKLSQYCLTFYNKMGRGQEAGVKGTGGGNFRPLCLPPL